MRVRVEQFGGLVAVDDSIVAVNRAAMRALGINDSPLWNSTAPVMQLRAPIEAQLVVTRRCIATCDFCSVDAHAIQPFYAGLLARACGLKVDLRIDGGTVIISTAEAAPRQGLTAAACLRTSST